MKNGDVIMALKCPKCGAELILKNGIYGDFGVVQTIQNVHTKKTLSLQEIILTDVQGAVLYY